ncbi:hypothetical protein HYT74_01205 [Candidatus Daviesbacteria bacterium]|nr:hypothetical protein [Candidatus Daviesbacteria bacterium]MBI2334796.1 hypothetical protein [Candidatus Daviesbacteria bacterium]
MRTLRNKKFLLVLLLIAVAGFLRFFKLGEYPVVLNHDEISQIYETASIVQTGKDIYGNFLPLAFPSTGDYKPGHYIYLSTLPYLIFGDQEATIRVTAAFFGTLTVLGVFLFVKALTQNWKIAYLSGIMVAFTPSEIFYSRKSFEGVIGESLIFFGLFALLKGRYIGALLLGLSMYVYTSYIIVVPLLLLFFLRKRFLPLLLIWLAVTLPLVLLIATNQDLRFRAGSVFITQDPNFQGSLDYIFNRYLNQFDPTYLFLNGLNLTDQGVVGMGPLLLLQLPFLILGLFRVNRLLVGLMIVSVIPSAVTFEQHSPHRATLFFAALSIISALGLHWFIITSRKPCHFMAGLNAKVITVFRGKPGGAVRSGFLQFLVNFLRKPRTFSPRKFIRKWFVLLPFLIAGFLLNFVYFVRIYTVSYPYEKSQSLHYPFVEIAKFAWLKYQNFDGIVIDPKFGDVAPETAVAVHYYLAFYGNYPPAKLQGQLKLGEMSFDKFSIRPVNWGKDKNLQNTLIIASPWSIPVNSLDKEKIIKTFYFYNGVPAYYAIGL